MAKFTTLILDIHDVFCSWSPNAKTAIPPTILQRMTLTPTWFDYERGRITQEACYQQSGLEFSLDSAEISRAWTAVRETLQLNSQMIALIRELKSRSNGKLKVIAASNMSIEDYEFIRQRNVADWNIFDEAFISGQMGERKPSLGFYRRVIQEAGIDPLESIFVDDKLENILSARSLGFYGLMLDKAEGVSRALKNLLGDPVQRGWEYLEANAGQLDCITDNGFVLEENLTQLIILELTSRL